MRGIIGSNFDLIWARAQLRNVRQWIESWEKSDWSTGNVERDSFFFFFFVFRFSVLPS